MNAREIVMPRKPNPEFADDDVPELTAEWFERAKPASKLLPQLIGKSGAAGLLIPERGRPPIVNPKEHVNIRLDADIVHAFKSQGLGWQTRVKNALRE
jgi:uncharacterized protein (DUF4415 family)